MLYVGEEEGQLYRIEGDGTPRELLGTGGFMLGLAADAAGRIYAIDAGAPLRMADRARTGSRAEFTPGSAQRPFVDPNWGAFGPEGSCYLSDSGRWGETDGCLWRVPPGGSAEVWSEQSPAWSRCRPGRHPTLRTR